MKVKGTSQSHLRTDPHRPWWRSLWLGYPCAVLFTVVALLIPLVERSFRIQDFFIGTPFVLATLFVGGTWGLGPALLALLLEVLALDYWVVPPIGTIGFFRWPRIVSFAWFLFIQLVMLALVMIQKHYRQQLHLAKQAASHHAEELAESNARLQQADQMKDQFLAMASHELRTPITSIHGRMQLLQRRLRRQDPQNPEWLPVRDSLNKMDEQIQRLTVLVSELLDINTLRSGRMPLHLVPCDLCGLCQHIVEEQHPPAGRSIDLRLPAHPVVVQADQGRLSQVVSNLVTNALKYSPAQTRICVEVSQRPGEALLAVSNEGPVLSEEQQKALFQPFYRSPETQASATPGWGLGLAICQEIVLQHGGRIWVESSAEKGTTFFVTLALL